MTDESKEKSKQEWIDELLAQPVLARLATTNAKTLQPHVVPLWFLWDGETARISSFVSTRKIKDLHSNPRCAVIVEPKQDGYPLQAVLPWIALITMYEFRNEANAWGSYAQWESHWLV